MVEMLMMQDCRRNGELKVKHAGGCPVLCLDLDAKGCRSSPVGPRLGGDWAANPPYSIHF